MVGFFFFLLVLLLGLAGLTREPFLFTLIYLVAGVLLLGQWWSRRAIESLTFQRTFSQRVFPGELVNVILNIQNKGWLPLVWLRIQELLPIELTRSASYQQVISLGSRQRIELTYLLEPQKRGYYPVGPLLLTSGDLLGISNEKVLEAPAEYLTVYPRVIPLQLSGLPSRSPFGTLRHTQPVFEDPTRPVNKRDYQQGDSLRRIDWKTTASVGRLQVKLFEPAIALETAIFLDLSEGAYDLRSWITASELAIETAASLAAWIIDRKQSAGLVTNGHDPLKTSSRAQPILPHKGRGHLMRILETLARISSNNDISLAQLLHQERVHLGWGTTLVLITGSVNDVLFDEMFQAQRAGANLVLVLCGRVSGLDEIRRRAQQFGIYTYSLWNEQDLRVWQG